MQRTHKVAGIGEVLADLYQSLCVLRLVKDFRKGMEGDENQVESIRQRKVRHVLVDDPARQVVLLQLLPKDLKHLFRVIDTREIDTSPKQGNGKAASAARQFEDLTVGLPRFLEKERVIEIGADIGVVQVCNSAVRNRLVQGGGYARWSLRHCGFTV